MSLDYFIWVRWKRNGTKNMGEKFNLNWINVINKITMEWHNKSPPGFMRVGRKPHPFENDCYTTCCDITSILWRAQILYGKDRLAHLIQNIHYNIGRKSWIVLKICKPLFSMGKCVVMGSGFCVANDIVSLAAKGVYACTLIKMRYYFPKSVPWDLINRNFQKTRWGM